MMLSLTVLASLWWGCSTPEPTVERPPDVVLVTLDTTRADRLGIYGHREARTPVLDHLGKTGWRFTRVTSPRPLTIPSHAALFTGRYPSKLGIHGNGDAALAAEAVTLAERLQAEGWHTAASVGAYVTTRVWGFDQGFDAYFDDVPITSDDFWKAERRAEDVVADASAWWRATEGPRFLWVHLFDPHFPYAPPDGWIDPDDPRPYDAELAYVDDQIGRLLALVDPENTLIVVVGDHGEGLGDHGEIGHGLFVYEAMTRVPWLMTGPGVEPRVMTQPVSLVDVAPTMLDLLGLPPLDDVDGTIRPAKATRPVATASWELQTRFGIAPHRAVVEGRWKLIDLPRPELYDVAADPDEQTDRAAEEPAIVERLRAALANLALPPPTADGARVGDIAALEALGYVQVAGASDGPLDDPKDHPDLVRDVQKAERAQLAGDTAAAEAVLREVVGRHPTLAEPKARLSLLLARTGRRAEAEAVLDEALAIAPSAPTLRAQKAGFLATSGRTDEAAEMFAALAEEQPQAPRLRALALAAWRESGARGKALSRGRAWHDAFPDDDLLAGVLGILELEAGDVATGAALLEQGVEAERPEPEVAWYLAAHTLLGGDLERGAALLELETAHHPAHLRAWAARARVAVERGLWTEVVVAARQVLAIRPDDAEMHHLEVLGLFNLQQYAAAREAVAAGLAVAPRHPGLVLMDANLMAKAGRMDEGRARFEEAKALRAAAEAARAEADGRAEALGVPAVGGPGAVPP